MVCGVEQIQSGSVAQQDVVADGRDGNVALM